MQMNQRKRLPAKPADNSKSFPHLASKMLQVSSRSVVSTFSLVCATGSGRPEGYLQGSCVYDHETAGSWHSFNTCSRSSTVFFTLHPVASALVCRHDPWRCVYAASHPSPWSSQGCDVSRIIGWSKQRTRLDSSLAWHLAILFSGGERLQLVSRPSQGLFEQVCYHKVSGFNSALGCGSICRPTVSRPSFHDPGIRRFVFPSNG